MQIMLLLEIKDIFVFKNKFNEANKLIEQSLLRCSDFFTLNIKGLLLSKNSFSKQLFFQGN